LAAHRVPSCASGAYVAAGGAWTPIGAEQVGSVYEVAWKNGTADQYLEWIVDGSGNYITQGSIVSGSTWWVQSFESAHQDLNNDGTIGPVTTTIEASGSATLVQVADLLREPGFVRSPVALWRHLCGGG
jgi:hypothetical protein